ncbi:MAG: DnaD domain protein [Clostridiaceae bacterium]
MSTFMFKNKLSSFTPLSNVFIDKYMITARGEFVKVYILGLKYCLSGELGINTTMLAQKLQLLEADVINAWSFWNDQGVVKLTPLDSFGNYSIEFIDLDSIKEEPLEEVDLLKELKNDSTKGMLEDIEKLIGRPLSPKEMSTYLSWQKDYSFSQEIILMLIEYCVSKGKTDFRYIEKIAIAWNEANIKTVDNAQTYIKRHEDKWISIRKILTYLGIKEMEVMKPQEILLDKWLNTYKMPLDVIFRACDICFERINKAEFRYIDSILTNWNKDNIRTIEEINLKDTIKKSSNKTYKKQNGKNTTTGNFNNFEQRTYDFDDLEKKLLGWDKYDK